jgi:hypothetical protein
LSSFEAAKRQWADGLGVRAVCVLGVVILLGGCSLTGSSGGSSSEPDRFTLKGSTEVQQYVSLLVQFDAATTAISAKYPNSTIDVSSVGGKPLNVDECQKSSALATKFHNSLVTIQFTGTGVAWEQALDTAALKIANLFDKCVASNGDVTAEKGEWFVVAQDWLGARIGLARDLGIDWQPPYGPVSPPAGA